MTQTLSPSPGRQPELDWLRGAAALAVVMFHYFHKGPAEGWIAVRQSDVLSAVSAYGYLGVHLFFMISGYVIMMTAQGASVRSFVASRVSRLLPALWVCATLTAAVEWSIPGSPFKPASWWQYVANLTLVPGVFGQAPMDGAYWSLAIEINFYTWVAVAIALGLVKHAERLLLLWLLLSAVNFLRPMYPVQLLTSAQWAPLFSAGAFYFFVRQSGWTVQRRLGLFAAGCLACLYAWREAGAAAGSWAFWPEGGQRSHLVVLALMLLFFGVFHGLSAGRVRVSPTRWSALSGSLTYPLYLVHQNIGYALFAQATAIGLVGFVGPVTTTWGLMAGALCLAYAVHHAMERRWGPPLRRWLAGA